MTDLQKSNPSSSVAPQSTTADSSANVPQATLGFAATSWWRAGREGAWVLGGQVAVAVAGLVGIRILTELTPRSVLGEVSLLLGVLMLSRSIFVGPFANGQLRFHPEYAERRRSRWFTRQMTRLNWQSTAVAIGIFSIGFFIWRARIDGNVHPVLLAALILIIALEVPKSLRLNRLNAERLRALSAVWSGAEAVLCIAFIAGGMLIAKTAEGYVLGQALGTGTGLLIFGYLSYPSMSPDDGEQAPEAEKELRNRVLMYGAAFVPLAILGWVSNLGDRYLLDVYLGAREVGVYSAAYGLASRPFLMVSGVAAGFARPILFQAESAQQYAKSRRVFVLWMVMVASLSILGVLGFWLLGRWVAHLLLAAEYREQAPQIFVWVGIGYACVGLTQTIETRLLSFNVSSRLIWPTLFGALANIGMNFLLIPRFGIVGAAQSTAATFAFQLILVSLSLYFAKRRGGST